MGCEVNQVSQPVLCILQLDLIAQPIPVEVGVCREHPWHGFDQPHVEVWLSHNAEDDFGGVSQSSAANMLEAGIAERCDLPLKVAASAQFEIGPITNRQGSRRKPIQTSRLPRKIPASLAAAFLQLRKVGLGDTERGRRFNLGQSGSTPSGSPLLRFHKLQYSKSSYVLIPLTGKIN